MAPSHNLKQYFLSIWLLWTYFHKIKNYSFNTMHFKMLSSKCQPFCSGFHVFKAYQEMGFMKETTNHKWSRCLTGLTYIIQPIFYIQFLSHKTTMPVFRGVKTSGNMKPLLLFCGINCAFELQHFFYHLFFSCVLFQIHKDFELQFQIALGKKCMLYKIIWISFINAYPVHIWNWSRVITMPADVTAPNSARPSAGTALTMVGIFSLMFGWSFKISDDTLWLIYQLTHWGRVTHICVRKLTTFDSDNSLSPGRRQAIISTNAGILLIWTLGPNFSEILIEIHTFSFTKMHLKMSSRKWQTFCLSLNVLTHLPLMPHICVSEMGQHWFRLWLLAYLAPSHYLNKR